VCRDQNRHIVGLRKAAKSGFIHFGGSLLGRALVFLHPLNHRLRKVLRQIATFEIKLRRVEWQTVWPAVSKAGGDHSELDTVCV